MIAAGRLGGPDAVLGRIGHEAPDQNVDVLVEGRGEQHPLGIRRGRVHQPPHHRQEPQIRHVIRFVEHADLDVAEVAVALLDQVGQPAGAGDDDVGTGAQRGHLRVLRDTAEDRRDAQAHRAGQRHEDRLDLAGELAGRHEHEAAGAAGAGEPVGQPGGQRDREAERLAGSGLPPAEDVQAGEGVREGGGLNGEGRGDAVFGQRRHQRGGHARGGEGDRGRDGDGARLAAVAPAARGGHLFGGQSSHRVSPGCRVAAWRPPHPWKPARSRADSTTGALR